MCELLVEDFMIWCVKWKRCLRIPKTVWYSRENLKLRGSRQSLKAKKAGI